MFDKVLARIRANESFLSLYLNGMSALYQSGVFDLLREIGRARLIGMGENQNVMAAQAAHSAGYNQALEDLLYFKDKFLEPVVQATPDLPDYGGLQSAFNKGDLLEVELNAIRSNTAPKYPTKPTPSPTTGIPRKN